MKTVSTNPFARPSLATNSWLAILILIPLAIPPTIGYGQLDKTMESLLIPDASIQDFLAIATTDTINAKSLKLMFKIKKDSLGNRLKQTESMSRIVIERIKQSQLELEECQAMADVQLEKAREKSSLSPISRDAVEQLLIAAQLELQRVSWDLASEVALYETIDKIDKEVEKSGDQTSKLEQDVYEVEFRRIIEELNYAQSDFQKIETNVKNGMISSSEASKARLAVSKAESAVKIHELRKKVADAQQKSKKEFELAAMSAQIRKLSARKKQVESYIQDLFQAVKDLGPREQIMARKERSEKTMATLTQVRHELEFKRDEIKLLLDILNSDDTLNPGESPKPKK